MATDPKTPGTKPLFVAVGMALLGLLFMHHYLSEQEKMVRGAVREQMVAVMTTDVPLSSGDTLDLNHLSHRMVDKSEQPSVSIQFEDPSFSRDSERKFEDAKAMLHGQVVGRSMEKGEILLWTDLERPPEDQLSTLFDGRLRALAVTVERSSFMGGLLQPNDRVDVLATFPAGMTIQGGVSMATDKTMVMLENVTVLSVGGRMGHMAAGGRVGGDGVVVLALEPEDALRLSHVQTRAQLSLLLRPMDAQNAGDFNRFREISDPDVQKHIEELMKKRQQN